MTRSTQLTHAISGQTKRRAGTDGMSAPGSMKFLSFEENGGAFHWTIVAAGGDRFVPSATFVSSEEARQAAGVVRSGSVSAPFENRADDPAALELAARLETATVADDLDAERWMGSESAEVSASGRSASSVSRSVAMHETRQRSFALPMSCAVQVVNPPSPVSIVPASADSRIARPVQ
jgi:hypothetical protein